MNIIVIGNSKSIKIESEYDVSRDQNIIGILPAVKKSFETFVASTQCYPSPILRYGYSPTMPQYDKEMPDGRQKLDLNISTQLHQILVSTSSLSRL